MKQIIFTAILIFAFCFAAFAQVNENPCPKIRLKIPEGMLRSGEFIKFKAEVSNEIEKYKVGYVWTVSGGKIIQGQGKPEIEFSAGREDAGSNITVTIKLMDLPENCAGSASDTFVIAPIITDFFPDDEYGKIPFENEKVRLDGITVRLANIKDNEGFIILEFNKKDKHSYRITRLNNILNHIKFRKFDLARITFVIFEGELEKTQLWVIPDNVEFLEIKSKDYQLIKAEKLKQKIKELFPKK